MTPPPVAVASCNGKKGFQTPQLAFAALSRNHRRADTRVFYRCRFCGKFHIGGRAPGALDD